MSFGAVSTALSLPYFAERLHAVVLWNPVLDLRRTFLEPELPWGLETSAATSGATSPSTGFYGWTESSSLAGVLFEEFRHYQPGAYFANSTLPALVIHGDKDTYVSYDIARTVAASRHRTRPRHRSRHAGRPSSHQQDSGMVATSPV